MAAPRAARRRKPDASLQPTKLTSFQKGKVWAHIRHTSKAGHWQRALPHATDCAVMWQSRSPRLVEAELATRALVQRTESLGARSIAGRYILTYAHACCIAGGAAKHTVGHLWRCPPRTKAPGWGAGWLRGVCCHAAAGPSQQGGRHWLFKQAARSGPPQVRAPACCPASTAEPAQQRSRRRPPGDTPNSL